MEGIFSDFGKRLREARNARGLTQSELCGDTVTRNQLSLIESGKSLPSLTTLCYFADRLGVPVGYFFAVSEEEKIKYSSFFALDEIKALYASGDYLGAIEAGRKIDPSARNDEISMLLALSYFKYGLDLADSYVFGEAVKCLRLSRKEALSSLYTVSSLPSAVNYYIQLISSVTSDTVPTEIMSPSSISSYVPADIVYYFKMLSDDNFDFESYEFTDGPIQLHAEAVRLMRLGSSLDAFDILMPLSRETSLPFYMRYQILSTLESCAGIVGEYESAYDASRMKLDIIRSAEESKI